ncbi:MAG: patatin-like phospholipase family protein, partial [Bacteroidales bacterium]|nr:patatin-like phospholipase family protein [Bacteroidales bacterium]
MKNLLKHILFSFCLLFSLSCSVAQDNQTLGLTLSGGGAKGLAHIGVLKALEQENIPIDYICGTSMGAIIGGLYASGYSVDEIENIFISKEFDALLSGIIEQD